MRTPFSIVRSSVLAVGLLAGLGTPGVALRLMVGIAGLCLLCQGVAFGDTPITRLEIQATTGNDDLRDGSQAFFTYQLRDRPPERTPINRRKERLPDRTTNTVQVNFPRPVALEDLTEVGIDFVAGSKQFMGKDEWMLESLSVKAYDAGNQLMSTLVDQRLRKKFTHTSSWRSGPLQRARAEDVALIGFEVTVETGDDDLTAESGLSFEVEQTTGVAPIQIWLPTSRRLADRSSYTVRAMLTTRDAPRGRILNRNIHRMLLQYHANREFSSALDMPDEWELRGVTVRGVTPDNRLIPVTSSGAIRQKFQGKEYWVSAPLRPRVMTETVHGLPLQNMEVTLYTGNDDLRDDSGIQGFLVIRGREYKIFTIDGKNKYKTALEDRTEWVVRPHGDLLGNLSSYRLRDVERIRIKFTSGPAYDNVIKTANARKLHKLGQADDQWELLWVGLVVTEPRSGARMHVMREFRKQKFSKNNPTWESAVLPSYSTATWGYGRAGVPADR